MIILIDGYNLLRHIFSREKGCLERQRKELVKQLGYYKSKKKRGIKEIILVFDAGPFGHATREVHDGIVVMFSGQNSSADEWIIQCINKKKGKEILLVTLDRKLIDKCKKSNVSSMSVFEFYHILQKNLLDNISSELAFQTPIQRYENIDIEEISSKTQSKALDLLMEEATIKNIFKDKEEEENKTKIQTRRNPRRSSKKEKKKYSRIKKLN
jgi:predicted RNA-binding protein with PIN domain